MGDTLYCVGGFDGDTDCLAVTESLDMSKPLARERWQLSVETQVYRYICARILLHMCPHTAVYVSAY